MSEQPITAAAPQPTGIPSIDSVLDLVAGLDERPLEEHAEIFETAHAALRRTLENPGDVAGDEPTSLG